MRKSVGLMIIILVGFFSILKAQSGYMIFNSTGHVVVLRGVEVIDKLQGKVFYQEDKVVNTNGSVSFVNKDYKRVTITDPGEYNYNNLTELFAFAESSLTNKYFVYVWEKMNSDDDEVNKPGGVIRGDEWGLLPWDSAVIVSDSIWFKIPNVAGNEFTLNIMNTSNNILFSTTIIDSVLIDIASITEVYPGNYYWNIVSEFSGKPEKRVLIIPDPEKKKELLEEYSFILREFSEFSDYQKTMLMDEYLWDNKIYHITYD